LTRDDVKDGAVARGPRRSLASRVRGGAVLVGGALVLSGCTDWAGYDLDYFWDYIPTLSTMRTTVSYDPYDMPRLPAPHSVPAFAPNGDIPPPFTQLQLDSAAATLSSPLAAGDPAVLARGQERYAIHCATCHGPEGAGDGPVVGPGKYPFAPAVNGDITAARSDGYLYAVTVAGRGLMPPYGDKLAEADRWAIVAYLRDLQRRGDPIAVPGVPTVVDPQSVTPGGTPLVDTAGVPRVP
jgi:mono/diheme cytochrome c family protein